MKILQASQTCANHVLINRFSLFASYEVVVLVLLLVAVCKYGYFCASFVSNSHDNNCP